VAAERTPIELTALAARLLAALLMRVTGAEDV